MACNCKAKDIRDAAIKMSGEEIDDKSGNNIFYSIAIFLMRVVLGVIIAAVFLLLAIPAVIYVAVCIIIGRQPTINIGKAIKLGSKLNG
jgi:hypothetical protein